MTAQEARAARRQKRQAARAARKAAKADRWQARGETASNNMDARIAKINADTEHIRARTAARKAARKERRLNT